MKTTAPNPSTPEATRPESTSETWEVGWGIGLTGPNMAALCAYDFQRNRVIPVRCGMRLVAAVPTSEGDKSNLIAAAPDMLAALKAAQEELRLLHMKDTATVYNAGLNAQISLAIQKAGCQ